MRHVQILFVAALVAALLGACSQPVAQPGPTPEAPTTAPAATTPDATGAYPAPSGAYPAPSNPASAYPGAATPEPAPTLSMDPITVPQPASSEVGVVSGTLYRTDNDGQRVAYRGGTIFLGTVKAAEGIDAIVELDRSTAPAAAINGLGQFVFVDVPPGRYGLMLQTLEGSLLLNNPQDGQDLIVEVTGGQITEMGELTYPLPDPGN